MSWFGAQKKWFWVGIGVSFFCMTPYLSALSGIFYGAVLAKEQDHRKEGIIIIIFAIAWILISALFIIPGVFRLGLVPQVGI